MKRHALLGEPLVSPFTGEVIAPTWYQDLEERAGDVDEDGRWVWDGAGKWVSWVEHRLSSGPSPSHGGRWERVPEPPSA
ncbi:MAG TPA: hypothetical protein VGR16_06000 [Thermomicrobiales bacterium]|nr:hypothetical protein [Thermomicrobiales bacterium]